MAELMAVKRAIKIIAAVFMVLGLSSQSALGGMVSALKQNTPAPNFTLKSILGDDVSLQSQQGKVVLINFWASWCAPCRKEMPALESLYQKYQPLGFTVLGINVDSDQTKGIEAAAKAQVSFPVLFDIKKTATEQYDVQAMPTTVIVDRTGKVKYVHFGYKRGDEAVYAEKIKAIIKGTL